MTGNVPYLTGGILFGLILEGIRPKSKARRGDWEGQTDGLSEPDIMKSLIDIFAGGTQPTPYETSFKKNVSDYKKCVISSATYIPFEDQSNINSFKDSIEQNKIDTLESMSMFINEKLSDKKLKWLVSAIVETICQDNSISTSERFSISLDKTVSKEELWTLREIVIEPFLLDVMRYIFVNRVDNTLGKSTFELWFSQEKKNTPWKFSNLELGKSVIGLKVTRYEPNKTKIEEQTDRKVEYEHVEELDSRIEKENIFKTERSESVKQQVLNNPKVVNQYANNIYNIEHVENLN